MNVVDIVGWILGLVAVILTIMSIYYLYRVAKSYGGKIGKAFIRLSLGIIFVMIAAIIMGVIMQLDSFCGEARPILAVVAISLPAILGVILILIGNRGLISTAKE